MPAGKAKNVNLAAVLKYCASGDLDNVRKLRDLCTAQLRKCRVDPDKVAASAPVAAKNEGSVNFNEASVRAYVESVWKKDAANVANLKTILAACKARG